MLTPKAWTTPRAKPTGVITTTHSSVSGYTWHYVLATDIRVPWKLSERDLYPPVSAASGWVARRWHAGHAPNLCQQGAAALSSGCIAAVVRGEDDMPAIANDRPVMVQNDTHVFDLWQFAPIAANGWVVLGDTSRYVSGSGTRFLALDFLPSGVRAQVGGSLNEQLALTALRPKPASGPLSGPTMDWDVVIKQVTFTSDAPVTVDFTSEDIVHM